MIRLGTRMADFRIPRKSSKFSLYVGSLSPLSRLRRNFVSLVANYKCLFQCTDKCFLLSFFYKEVVRKTTPTSGVALLVGHVQSPLVLGWMIMLGGVILLPLVCCCCCFFVYSHLTSLLQVVYNGKNVDIMSYI